MFGEHLDASAHNGSDVFKRRGQPSHDYYGDRIIAERGMWTTRGKPCHNRFCTVFCYLNDVEEGGSTSFTWIGKHLGKDGKGTFYETPNSFSTVRLPSATPTPSLPWLHRHRKHRHNHRHDHRYNHHRYCKVLPKGKASPPLRIQPERGMAVVHFPCTTPETGGYVTSLALPCPLALALSLALAPTVALTFIITPTITPDTSTSTQPIHPNRRWP